MKEPISPATMRNQRITVGPLTAVVFRPSADDGAGGCMVVFAGVHPDAASHSE
jgi:hypothetical protein